MSGDYFVLDRKEKNKLKILQHEKRLKKSLKAARKIRRQIKILLIDRERNWIGTFLSVSFKTLDTISRVDEKCYGSHLADFSSSTRQRLLITLFT